MFRILLVVAWLAVTVYAIADWARTPEEEMPGRIPRLMWLIIILLTIPSFSIGSVVWLIVRAVGRAESESDGTRATTPHPIFPRPARQAPPTPPPAPLAPDDDPEFLFRLERDIRRRRAAEEGRNSRAAGGPDTTGRPDGGSGAPDAPVDHGDDGDHRGDGTGAIPPEGADDHTTPSSGTDGGRAEDPPEEGGHPEDGGSREGEHPSDGEPGPRQDDEDDDDGAKGLSA